MKIPKRPGYFQVFRDLHGVFSPNMAVDFQAWSVYALLQEQANWGDGGELCKGELTVPFSQISAWTGLDRNKVKRLVKRYKELGLLIISKPCTRSKSYVFSIPKKRNQSDPQTDPQGDPQGDPQNPLELLDQISDPDMLRLREILGAEIAELSEGCKAVLDLLKETDKKDFTKTLERIAAQLEKRQRSIEDVITSQLYSHLNHDILGRMRISEMRFKIKRRARILKQFIRSL